MQLQTIYNLTFMSFDQPMTFDVAGYTFSNDSKLRDCFYNNTIRESFGVSNAIFPNDGCFVYYSTPIDLDMANLTSEQCVKHFKDRSTEINYLFGTFIDFLWIIKDNCINIINSVSQLKNNDDTNEVPYTSIFCLYGKSLTSATGKHETTSFTKSEVLKAYYQWERYRKLVNAVEKPKIEETSVYDISIDNTYLKSYHKDFDYNKSTFLERAFNFLYKSREEDYLIYKIAMVMPVFECLFSTDNDEITSKLKTRISFYMGADMEERISIDKLIGDCYSIRSIFLHGQVRVRESAIKFSEDTLRNNSVALDNLLRKILTRIIEQDADHFLANSDEKAKWFRKLIYNNGIY